MAQPATASVTTVQKNILAAIKALSDRMDAQDIAATTAMELHFTNQEEISDLRASKRVDPLAARLESIDKGIKAMGEQLSKLNGTVRQHDTDLTVIKTFCDEQVKPALLKVIDLRIEFAKFIAAGGGFGVVVTVLIGVGKSQGWW